MAVLDFQGRKFAEVITTPPPDERPQPQQRPALGWEPGLTDRPFMVRHLGYEGQLKFSNETIRAFEYKRNENRVVSGEVTVQMQTRFDWQKRIEDMNSFKILELFISHAFGFCDSKASPDNRAAYDVDAQIPYHPNIDVGGNRRNCKEIITKSGNRYAIFETQDWNGEPNPNISYATDPHLMTKQVDYGQILDRPPFWVTSSVGDCVWDLNPPVELCHWMNNVTFYPGYQDISKPFQPFDCWLFGFYAWVIGYCFTGSNTWVLVDDGDLAPGWYQADGHSVPIGRSEPEPGSDKDYFMNISGVAWPFLTPPVAGWRKE